MRIEMWTDTLKETYPFQVSLMENGMAILRCIGKDGVVEINCCIADLIDLVEKVEILLTKQSGET